jgi:hypothetical protein
MRRISFVVVAVGLIAGSARGQSADADGERGRWHGTVALANLFDGNINHELEPVRSYGIVPAGEIVFQSSREPAFEFGYEIAANRFTGTDEWNRISHSMYSTWSYRAGSRVRLDSGAAASWKGSSEDRELANEFGLSQRIAWRVSQSTRLVASASYRYKQYPDDPGTSGPSPYVGAKFDQRLRNNRRIVAGYKYQTRMSHTVRDRYHRSAYTLVYSMPGFTAAERLSFEVEYRPQHYERLVKLPGRQELRFDRRYIAGAVYERPVSERATARWVAGVETRNSNDASKHFFAPTFGVTISYRVR